MTLLTVRLSRSAMWVILILRACCAPFWKAVLLSVRQNRHAIDLDLDAQKLAADRSARRRILAKEFLVDGIVFLETGEVAEVGVDLHHIAQIRSGALEDDLQ